MNYRLLQGDNRAVLDTMPAKSIHAIICSPPYFGLRSYSGDQQVEWPTVEYAPMPGLPMLRIQGCEPGCKHEWGETQIVHQRGSDVGSTLSGPQNRGRQEKATTGQYCQLCGGWRGGLGNEPTLEAYIGHLILCLRSWHRVLRDDGCAFVNLGDSFAGSGGAGGDYNAGGIREGQPKFKPGNPKNGLKAKDLQMVPARFALAAQADGWYVRSRIIWAKGVSFLPDYAGSCMPECLDPQTTIFIRNNGWVSKITLQQLADMNDAQLPMPEILSPNGWVEIKNIWKTVKPAMAMRAGRVERVICSPEHRFPISSDRRRVKVRYEEAQNIRHEGYADYLLYCPIDKFLEPSITQWQGRPLSHDLGYLIGVYAAEGGIDGDSGFRIKLTIGLHEPEFLARIINVLNSFKVLSTQSERGNAISIRFSEEWIQRIILCFVSGDVKTKALNIEMLLNTPVEFRQGLLDGYVEGDGSDRKGGGWSITSASRRLRDDISTLASSLGIVTSKGAENRQYDERTDKTYASHTLWTPYMTKRKQKSGTEGVYQVPPRDRNMLDGERKMIDIEVEGHVFIIGDGLVTHNSVQDRPTKSDEDIYLLTKQPSYYWDHEAVKEKAIYPDDNRKARQKPEDYKSMMSDTGQVRAVINPGNPKTYSSRSLRSVWVINPQGWDGAHFAVWPEKLVAPMVKASTSEYGCCAQCGAPYERVVERQSFSRNELPTEHPHYRPGYYTRKAGGVDDYANGGGQRIQQSTTTGWQATCTCAADVIPCTVCDPFAGSGTTGAVACAHNRNYIGIDLSADYITLAHERIREAINESGRAYIAPVCKVADFVDLPLFGG